MAKTIIAVDIDEVLSPFMPGLVDWHNMHYGTSFQISDFSNYNLDLTLGGTREEAIQKCGEYFLNRDPKITLPLAHAQRVLTRLKQDYQLIIVTSRTLLQKDHTETWLLEHLPDTFSQVVMCNHWTNDKKNLIKKSKACLNVGAKYLIDDLPHYIEDAVAAGISGLLFGEYPWNQQISVNSQICRVTDWIAVEKYFYPS